MPCWNNTHPSGGAFDYDELGERLREIVVRSDAVGSKGLADVLGMMARYKAVPYTLDRARGYVEAGKAALSAFPDSIHVDALRALADYVVDRDS